MVNRKVKFENLGLVEYQTAWDYQEKLFRTVVSAKKTQRESKEDLETPNFLLFCEHPHVYTLGKSGKESNLLINENFLKSKGASLFRINRGGDITYHGPGQVVGYPILDLDNFGLSVKSYIYNLEEVIINTLSEFGIYSSRMEGATGVWIEANNSAKARKICAIGVRTSHWVSMHGFALNVNTDLSYFDYIVPCGIQGKSVTSISKELNKTLSVDLVILKLKENFEKVFGMQIR